MDWVKKNKRKVNFFIDPNKAVENADVIFSDKVVSLNDKVNKTKKIKDFKNYRVNSNLMKNANDVEPPKVKRFNTLGASEMVTLDRGSAIFDAGETVVRTDNFDKLTAGINNLIAATVENKPHKPLAKWETTTLYR